MCVCMCVCMRMCGAHVGGIIACLCVYYTLTHTLTLTLTHTAGAGQEVANGATGIGRERGKGIPHNWKYLATVFHHFLNQIKIHPDTLSCD